MKLKTFTLPDSITLDSGGTLNGVVVAYHTFGRLNKSKSNVILICHPLTADSNAKQWWKNMVGSELPIDTNRYYVVCANVLGGCKGSTGPMSNHPDTKQPYLLDFPVVTIPDMVRCQQRLMDHLGVDTIKCVIGGSLGGMQALEWVAQAPDRVRSCVPIASCLKTSPTVIAFDSVGRQSILEHLKYGRGESGLKVARQLGHITYLSDQALEKKFARRLQYQNKFQYTMTPEFQVENYLAYQGEKFIERFNLYSYLTITKAVSYFDMVAYYGSIRRCFEASSATFLVMGISSDWLYTPSQSKHIAFELMTLNKAVSYVEIDSDYGHDTFLIDSDQTKQAISAFLEQ